MCSVALLRCNIKSYIKCKRENLVARKDIEDLCK